MSIQIRARGVVAAWVVSFALATGCIDREPVPVTPCTVSPVVRPFTPRVIDEVDVLFVVDDSNSMSQEQESLTQQIPRLVQVLASGDRHPEDGIDQGADFPPVRSLQFGVVTSDMGTGGFRVSSSCAEPNFGSDGILRTAGDTSVSGCGASYAPYQQFTAGGDAEQYARDVSCVASAGTDGCGYEQPLEAMLKAVTPSTSAMQFNMGTGGHADRENMGFVRRDSLLVVIVITDENDCSAADPDLYNPDSVVYTGDPNFKCMMYPEALHPVERFVDGLLATRASPDLLIYATISGVPVDLVDTPEEARDFDRILDDPRMIERPSDTTASELEPSCNVPGTGKAYPPRRLVQIAQQLEARDGNGVVQSICQSDFTPALDAVIEKIAHVLNQTCLPRALNPDADGTVECDVVEVLPLTGDVTRCDQVPGRHKIGEQALDEGVAEVCRVEQSGRSGVGWYYDDASDEVRATCGDGAQRIAFTEGAAPVNGTRVRLECLQPVQQQSSAIVDVGSPCRPEAGDATCTEGGALDSAPESRCARDLACDHVSRTWRQACTTNAHCAAGWACDADGFCLNPAC